MNYKEEEEFIKKTQGGVLLNEYTLKDVLWFMKHYKDIKTKIKDMKAIPLSEIHLMARSMKYADFEQQIKVKLTGQPETVVIDCEPVIVDLNDIIIKDK